MTDTFLSSVDTLHKFLAQSSIGFNDAFKALASQRPVAYPPYNIKKVNDNKYVIEVAVAGFAKTDIEVNMKGNELVIKGSTSDDPTDTFVYKGIAARNFMHKFALSDSVEIKDAELVNGMLKVWLENVSKAQDYIKKIAIK